MSIAPYTSQIKQKCGIIERENHDNSKCPPNRDATFMRNRSNTMLKKRKNYKIIAIYTGICYNISQDHATFDDIICEIHLLKGG